MTAATPPAAAETRAQTPAHTPAMTRRETLEALSGIILGMLVALLAATIVSSSMPLIVSELDGSQSSYTWVVTATLLAQTVSTPLWGKFADLFSRKVLIQVALVITVLSAAAAGFSQSIGQLIAFRGAQGLGAGGLMALATVLVADIVSPRERGRYMGIIGGFMAVAQVGGPLLGGVLTDSIGWRWNFFVGVPFAVAAILVLHKTLHLPTRPRRDAKIDYWGAGLISVGISLILLWVTFAASGSYDWLSWQTAVMLGVAVLCLVVAVLVERAVDEPVIPLDLFRNRTFVLAVVASVAVGVAMFGTAVFLSQYLQISRGKTPTESALLTIPMVAGTMIAGVVLGRIISATGRYKGIMIGGGVLLVASLLGMGTIDAHTSLWLVGTYLFGLGLSVGALMQNLVLAVQNTLGLHEMGAGTAAVAFFRSLGGAVGVTALGAVLATTVSHDITHGMAKLGVPTDAMGVGGTVPNIATLPGPVARIVADAYADGISEIFLVAVPMAVIALVCVLFLKEIPLGQRSGIQQALEEQAALDEAPEPALR